MNKDEINSIPYWSYKPNDLLSHLETSINGLTLSESEKRLNSYGLNILEKEKRHPFFLKIISKLRDPLILILLFASLISFLAGQTADFIIIAVIVFISIGLEVYQENQATEAVLKLKQKVSLTADVIRNGEKKEILVKNIVPGDIILLSLGDIIPADGLLTSSETLMLNQAILTGESFPADKTAGVEKEINTSVPERINSVFMGTHVACGSGMMVAVRTGRATELGKISTELVKKRPETQFQKGIKNFGFLLVRITFILVIFVFIINLLFHHEIFSSLLFSIALAIGMAPEILPVIMTVNLAKGAERMAKKGVIVKDLPSIQNFGSMEILCMDKTGTFTKGEIELASFKDANLETNQQVLHFGFISSFFETGFKSPFSQAVIKKASGDKDFAVNKYSKVAEIPFSFERQRLSVVTASGDSNILISQGSPEKILAICTRFLNSDKEDILGEAKKINIEDQFKDLSKDGFRVLAVAKKIIEKKSAYHDFDEKNMTFIGFLIFSDQPKVSAKEAFLKLENQGIKLKILTGDNELVTKKICDDIGIPINGVTLGSDLLKISDEQLLHLAKSSTIFARLTPSQKEKIILALKKCDYVVGFLGDGVNDAPSLRASDIGVSVNNGSDVAKESADLILLHKDLNILSEGVSEGRRTYGNIMKYIMMGTSSDFGNMASVAAASLFLPFLPMTPVQVLLNDLLYDATQLAIPYDNVDLEFIKKPKKWDVNFIKKFMLTFGPISSIFDFLTFFILLYFFRSTSHLFQTGWFLESITTQTLIVLSIRTSVVPFFKSKPNKFLIIMLFSVVVFAWILPLTALRSYFAFQKVPLQFYFLLISITFLYFILVEFLKLRFFKKYTLENNYLG